MQKIVTITYLDALKAFTGDKSVDERQELMLALIRSQPDEEKKMCEDGTDDEKEIKNDANYDEKYAQDKITLTQRKRLQSLYTGYDFRRDAFVLIEKYATLAWNPPSIPPKLIPDGFVDAFGSPLTSKTYCSPFATEKTLWSSLGSFLNLQWSTVPGVVVCPPLDMDVISQAVKHLITSLPELTKPIDIVVIVPVWDKQGLQYLRKLSSDTQPTKLDECLQSLATSHFRRWSTIHRSKECLFYDHATDKYTERSDNHVFHLCNYPSVMPIPLYFGENWVRLSFSRTFEFV